MSLETPYFDTGTKKNTEPDEVEINKYYTYMLSAADDETALNMLKDAYRNAIIEADDEIKRKKGESVQKARKDRFKSLRKMCNGVDKFIAGCFHLSKDNRGLPGFVYSILFMLISIPLFLLFAPILIIYDLVRMNDKPQDNEDITQGSVIGILFFIAIIFFLMYYAWSYATIKYVIDNWVLIEAILWESYLLEFITKCLGINMFFYGLGLVMAATISDLKAQNDTQLSIAFLSLLIAFASMVLSIIAN